jgi:hypothetical protein
MFFLELSLPNNVKEHYILLLKKSISVQSAFCLFRVTVSLFWRISDCLLVNYYIYIYSVLGCSATRF